jgi:hypothetical protein
MACRNSYPQRVQKLRLKAENKLLVENVDGGGPQALERMGCHYRESVTLKLPMCLKLLLKLPRRVGEPRWRGDAVSLRSETSYGVR